MQEPLIWAKEVTDILHDHGRCYSIFLYAIFCIGDRQDGVLLIGVFVYSTTDHIESLEKQN